MLIISHRANLSGIDENRENNPFYVDECIKMGYNIEVDLRIKDDQLYLGHDYAQYPITIDWILERKQHLWIHVKEFKALQKIYNHRNDIQFFCHENDKFTLTSNGLIWLHDLDQKVGDNCIIPLLSLEQVEQYTKKGFYGVCTDYVYECENKFKAGNK